MDLFEIHYISIGDSKSEMKSRVEATIEMLEDTIEYLEKKIDNLIPKLKNDDRQFISVIDKSKAIVEDSPISKECDSAMTLKASNEGLKELSKASLCLEEVASGMCESSILCCL